MIISGYPLLRSSNTLSFLGFNPSFRVHLNFRWLAVIVQQCLDPGEIVFQIVSISSHRHQIWFVVLFCPRPLFLSTATIMIFLLESTYNMESLLAFFFVRPLRIASLQPFCELTIRFFASFSSVPRFLLVGPACPFSLRFSSSDSLSNKKASLAFSLLRFSSSVILAGLFLKPFAR